MIANITTLRRAGELLKTDEKDDDPIVISHLENLKVELAQLREEESAYDEHIKWLQQVCSLIL